MDKVQNPSNSDIGIRSSRILLHVCTQLNLHLLIFVNISLIIELYESASDISIIDH
jgi:hypothetical protein